MTEARGVPVGLAVDGANRHDMKLVRATVDSVPISATSTPGRHPQGHVPGQRLRLWLRFAASLARVWLRRPHPAVGANRSRGEEAKAIKRAAGFKARRWVVERTHSWLNRFRRILVRWDKAPEHYIAFLHFACALIALRAAGLLG